MGVHPFGIFRNSLVYRGKERRRWSSGTWYDDVVHTDVLIWEKIVYYYVSFSQYLIRCSEMFTPEESVRVCFNIYNILLFLFVLFFLSCGFVSLSALSSVIFKFNGIILRLRRKTRTLTFIISLALLLLLCGIAAFPYRRLVQKWTWECLFSYNS